MAAGLGFKDFTTGEVLTAGDVDGYLMQGIWVFADSAARDAAVTSPQEGNFAFLKDTNTTTYYTGSAWTNLDTTGMVNPMTTTGDTIYSSSGSTPARLGIGSTGQVLTVAGGVPSWATPAGGGGMELLSTTSLSGTTVTVSSISGDYDHLLVTWNGVYNSAGGDPYFRFNSDTGSNYSDWNVATYQSGPSALPDAHMSNDKLFCMFGGTSSDWDKYNNGNMWIYNYTTTGTVDIMIHSSSFNGTDKYSSRIVGRYKNTAAISSITFFQPNGTTSFSGGTLKVWGVR